MKLPAHFYGLSRDVKRRNSRIVTQLCKGGDWMALIEASGFLDVETTPGFVVMDASGPLLGGEHHFHIWQLWYQIYYDSIRSDKSRRVSQALVEEVFARSLTRSWSTLGLVAYRGQDWLDEHNYRPFLRAVRQYWELFDSIGARYTDGSRQGFELWSLPNAIHFALANLGIPGDVLRSPLPPGGLHELIDRTEQRWN